MTRLLLIALLTCACDHEGTVAIDAGLDAPRRLAVTVDGPPAVQPTRTLKVTITSNGYTRKDTFPVGGLPATVDLAQPIQLSTWSIQVDGFDTNSQLIGAGSTDVPSGTTEATVTIAPTVPVTPPPETTGFGTSSRYGGP